jgi:alpha,alpha-trehalose phosphorylase
MIHHERLKPPPLDYPADEWNVIEKGIHPEFMAQLETMLALGNGVSRHARLPGRRRS